MQETGKKYSQFRTKVLKIFLFVGIVPLLVISFVNLATVIQTRLEDVSQFQLQVLSGTNEKIRRYLEQKTSVFNLVVELTPAPATLSEIEIARLNFLIENLMQEAKDVKEISFIDKYGNEIVKKTEIQEEAPVLENVSTRDDFQIAISGNNYFGPVNFTTGGPIMRIASPIKNRNREIIGAISAEIDLKPIDNIISNLRLGIQGFVYLIDEQGNLIASSNKLFANFGQNLSHINLIDDVLKNKIHEGKSLKDTYENSLGQRVIFSGRPVETVRWFIVSEWPWDDAFSVVQIMLNRFLMILGITLILIMVFSLFFTRLVVKPVEVLSRGADEISKGNFDYKINIKTRDELEKLGERFNKMITVLKENQRLRDEFVFLAAHELRAPVSVIKGYLSMILNGDYGKVNKEMEGALGVVNTSNERLVKLVEDLLEIAKSEAGEMEIEVKPVVIQESIKEVLKEFENSASKKGISLIYKDSEKVIKVMADSFRLKEVISNLIDNAIRYTMSRGDITVSHEIKENYLITHVKDCGVGIAEERIKKLFTKFYRVKAKETQDIEGTGLGLFICKEIVERMGGKIWAESQLGKGSTFSFSLILA